MTVRARLLLTLGGIILLLVLPAIYGITRLNRLEDLAVRLEVYHAKDVMALGELRASLSEFDRMQRLYVAAPDQTSFQEGVHRELSLARGYLGVLRQSGYEQATAPLASVLDSLETAAATIEQLMMAGERQAGTDTFERVKPVLDSARLALQPVDSALDERGRRDVEEARRVSASAARTTMLTAAVALLLTVILGLWTTDALSRPLRRLSEATAGVADGDFSAPEDLPYDREDEIGQLSRSFGFMTSRLAELDRLKAEFVSLASHELKTPINVIAGYAELLEEGLYGEMADRQREVLGLIQEQARALTRLVNQLLDLSRFEAGGLQVEPAEVEVQRLLDEVEQTFRALATQKQIRFDVERGEALPATAVLDHDRVRHEVLGNLLSNAFKFTSPGGEIRLRAWSEDQQIRFRVSDTGVGIPEDQLDHIFEKYYQVGDEAKAQGSGLGLAIAKHVVNAHGGEIVASSRAGEGTTFDISLPRLGPEE